MRDQLQNAIAAICEKLFSTDITVKLSRPDPAHGDFATNVAMQLAKRVGKSPREIAEAAIRELEQLEEVASATVAGPGFINIRLTDAAIVKLMAQQPAKALQGKRVLVEYSDPNPFKPLHAGHLYTTLVGDSIARLVEMSGAETIRINYGGDVGLHVGKCMWAIVKCLGGELPEKLGSIPAEDRASWLGARYVEGTAAYEDDEAAKREIIECNKKVYAIHENDDRQSPFAHIYWTCRQWSYDYFPVLYEQLKTVPFDRYIPESEVTPLAAKVVKEQLKAGVYEESDGAVIFDGEKHGLHKRVFISSEGLPTYEAKDVGLSLTKWRDYQFDESIIITAHEQKQYMQVVLKSIEQFEPEPACRTRHLTHGAVKLEGGRKMSSRKGNVVTALQILEEARLAEAQVREDYSEDTVLAAVKYSFAKNRIGSDIIYDPKESVALDGNSGPYLQYAHARACGILRKSTADRADVADLQAAERLLAWKIGEFAEVLELAASELMPHYICTYLYELAQTFNRFYENNRVIGDEREAVRLMLVATYAEVLKHGLMTLGIPAPERI